MLLDITQDGKSEQSTKADTSFSDEMSLMSESVTGYQLNLKRKRSRLL